MAILLMTALRRAGHKVELASELRAFLPDDRDARAFSDLQSAAAAERERLSRLWRDGAPPDAWFCYHPYYKSPDLIGPPLAREFGLPWISAEASLSGRRDRGVWAECQAAVTESVDRAAVNFAMTARDRDGLRARVPAARICALPPFLDLDDWPRRSLPKGGRIVTVAMMRRGDKMESYRAMAAALQMLPPAIDWKLGIAGDGPMRKEVEALFPQDRVEWFGQVPSDKLPEFLAAGSVYFWPGCGEAYGLAYLEAQAIGLPVVAWSAAGVPEVVADGETGLLAPEGDIAALADNLARLLGDDDFRVRMGATARARVAERHGIATAADILDREFRAAIG
ncbi:glycosyltransferase family 4 protein [Paracoccus sp. MBLB3053]|uniref:Glycosyltransferase family 4 protein n=1 Tax=Paracoccus aurantius TaxID=3073814 RepID=A0ABU2HYE0_9RHOB|nr:glycosyltransferase family 4 protein [Paracoccus sp. MBLB3053]MDS9470082.1 glycosyltransferase family 4 protein [Paracoccus sp. MBLB3053]